MKDKANSKTITDAETRNIEHSRENAAVAKSEALLIENEALKKSVNDLTDSNKKLSEKIDTLNDSISAKLKEISVFENTVRDSNEATDKLLKDFDNRNTEIIVLKSELDKIKKASKDAETNPNILKVNDLVTPYNDTELFKVGLNVRVLAIDGKYMTVQSWDNRHVKSHTAKFLIKDFYKVK